VRRSVVAALLLAVLSAAVGAAAGCAPGGASPGGTPATGAERPAAQDSPDVITPPAAAVPTGAALTTADLAWLQTIEELLPRMDAAFAESPRAMTRQALRVLAERLRLCARELTRLGAPSVRLRPVQVLAERACGEYERGADCFTHAADARSASGVQRDLACGFAAARRGGEPLADARARGELLRTAG
jgi:hypothetical protein